MNNLIKRILHILENSHPVSSRHCVPLLPLQSPKSDQYLGSPPSSPTQALLYANHESAQNHPPHPTTLTENKIELATQETAPLANQHPNTTIPSHSPTLAAFSTTDQGNSLVLSASQDLAPSPTLSHTHEVPSSPCTPSPSETSLPTPAHIPFNTLFMVSAALAVGAAVMWFIRRRKK